MGQSQPLFVFIITISIIQIEENVDGVLGIRTQGHRMVGTAKTTVLDSETSGSQSIEPGCCLRTKMWAVVVAQLVERSLPIPEVRGSNPVIGKNLFILNI